MVGTSPPCLAMLTLGGPFGRPEFQATTSVELSKKALNEDSALQARRRILWETDRLSPTISKQGVQKDSRKKTRVRLLSEAHQIERVACSVKSIASGSLNTIKDCLPVKHSSQAIWLHQLYERSVRNALRLSQARPGSVRPGVGLYLPEAYPPPPEDCALQQIVSTF